MIKDASQGAAVFRRERMPASPIKISGDGGQSIRNFERRVVWLKLLRRIVHPALVQ